MRVNYPTVNFNSQRKILALEIAQSCANLLVREFGAKKVILFGSLADQTPWHDFSDIDLAVEGLPEGIFRRIAINIDNSLPIGERSHLDLLNQMAEDIPNIRKAVISPKYYQNFKDYLGFRHFFRHAYGYQLRWSEIKIKLIIMPEIFTDFKSNIEWLFTEIIKNNKS